MDGARQKPRMFLDLKLPESQSIEEKSFGTGMTRSKSSGQLSQLAESPPVYKGKRRFSGTTQPYRPEFPSPLLTRQSSHDSSSTRSSPASTPIGRRQSIESTDGQSKFLPLMLSPIPPTPVRLDSPESFPTPSITIEEPDLPLPEGWDARRRSSQISIGSLGSEPPRCSTPDFLKMQSMLGRFHERRNSACAETLPKMPETIASPVEDESEDKKRMQFLASSFSQRRMSTPNVKTLPKLERKKTPPEQLAYLNDLPTIGGLEKVLAYDGQGIPKEHLVELAKACSLYRIVLSIRPFPETATQLALDDEESKPLRYKPKSSSTGGHTPYPPQKQKYGKLFDAPEEKLKKFQAYADEIEHESVQFKVTMKRLKELQKFMIPKSDIPLVEKLQEHQDGTITYESKPGPLHPAHLYRGKKGKQGKFIIEVQEDDQFKPFKIFPKIPDYDLCFLYSLQEDVDLAGKDKIPVPDITPDEIQGRIARLEKKQRLSGISKSEFSRIALEVINLKSFLKKMDQALGNISEREERLLRILNHAIGRSMRNPMFHHGADNKNPVSELDSNFPITVVMPRAIEHLDKRFYIIEDRDQLIAFINLLKDSGYYAPTNPAWGKAHQVRGKAFMRYSQITDQKMLPPRTH